MRGGWEESFWGADLSLNHFAVSSISSAECSCHLDLQLWGDEISFSVKIREKNHQSDGQGTINWPSPRPPSVPILIRSSDNHTYCEIWVDSQKLLNISDVEAFLCNKARRVKNFLANLRQPGCHQHKSHSQLFHPSLNCCTFVAPITSWRVKCFREHGKHHHGVSVSASEQRAYGELGMLELITQCRPARPTWADVSCAKCKWARGRMERGIWQASDL